jgi:hypothetical protein
MAEPQTTDLQQWIARVQKANNAKDVFRIMDEFRKGDWSDEDRARIAKVYVRVLDRVGAPAADQAAVIEEDKSDGPVWYEKM